MVLGGNDDQTRWLDRLRNVIEDLDVSGADRFDARIRQLKTAMISTAKLLLAYKQIIYE